MRTWCAFRAAHSEWDRITIIRRRPRCITSPSPRSGWTGRRSPTGNFASSSRRPGTSVSRKFLQTRRTIQARCRTCSMPARSSSHRRRVRSICATGVHGGPSSRARTGGIPTARRATSTGSTIIRWCMWRSPTRWLTPNGPARTCRPRPNGNSPRAAPSTVPSLPGVMSSFRVECIWRIPGRVNFRDRIFVRTASSAHRPSPHSRRTAMACTT